MKLILKIKNKLYRFIRSQPQVPGYDEKRDIINSYRLKYNLKVLVETGTFLGDTVDAMKNEFDKVISIELDAVLANRVKLRFESDVNVTILEGDSAVLLKQIIKETSTPILFWLDGHYSSEFFVGDEYIRTARGKKDTPVDEELRSIFAATSDHVILIDDARLFNGENDYPTIGQIKSMLRMYKKKYSLTVANDIIRILPDHEFAL